ncbi:16S rRNA (adenine(1518)-N(6)/adenine(1519)-N(6))-dimethyltransferase RsmA [Mycoplasma simbae]|uniref:16S rRNA (adenine(1518)-N(6)/adenine(1519)-N(6))- dimethyltransferase RsmA n=1 Tax=Mycoplasma simbae TaxID=36744 RepID=UPI00049660B3|nr:16S rRNA (adenine(1518)-N(6)/adenine(1519)-N(6))-dimethyltransferase RsmA [Mycoplasma simbae]
MKKNNSVIAKKKYGQNFISDPKLIGKIIDFVQPEGKNIIEIGPGLGALTQHLANKANIFKAFEIDPDMVEHLLLNKILTTEQIVNQDFLTADLANFKNYDIVGNIPYYITSEILLKIFDHRHNFNQFTLMVQDEVANRLVAKPNSHDYSKLSLTCQYVADVEKVLFVDKKYFEPIPKVDSAIVTIKFKHQHDDNYENIKDFFKLCFLARRKKLSFSLKRAYKLEQISNAYSKLGFEDNIRIQQLSLEQILNLFKELNS